MLEWFLEMVPRQRPLEPAPQLGSNPGRGAEAVFQNEFALQPESLSHHGKFRQHCGNLPQRERWLF